MSVYEHKQVPLQLKQMATAPGGKAPGGAVVRILPGGSADASDAG